MVWVENGLENGLGGWRGEREEDWPKPVSSTSCFLHTKHEATISSVGSVIMFYVYVKIHVFERRSFELHGSEQCGFGYNHFSYNKQTNTVLLFVSS